jgi:hypothetical protein
VQVDGRVLVVRIGADGTKHGQNGRELRVSC